MGGLSLSNMNYMSKKEKKELLNLVQNVKIDEEDSVWDLGVELCRWSVKLRATILSSDD